MSGHTLGHMRQSDRLQVGPLKPEEPEVLCEVIALIANLMPTAAEIPGQAIAFTTFTLHHDKKPFGSFKIARNGWIDD